MSTRRSWPYPRWIAHRGAGTLAPENTLAAFQQGAAWGYRMFECDAQLSADEVVFLLHDARLERTTDGHGLAAEQPWVQLAERDAGQWHSPAFAGERLPRLQVLAGFCLAHNHLLNIEIKASPGRAARTGEVVAREAARLWAGQTVKPLLTSFEPEALAAARDAAPDLPRGLLLQTLWPDWFAQAHGLHCVALVCHHPLWDTALVGQVHGAGMRCLSYTVNDETVADKLIALGLDGLITDRVDLFRPD